MNVRGEPALRAHAGRFDRRQGLSRGDCRQDRHAHPLGEEPRLPPGVPERQVTPLTSRCDSGETRRWPRRFWRPKTYELLNPDRFHALATLLLLLGDVSAQAADETFTVRVENVSAENILKLSNGKTSSVAVAPVLYVIHTNRGPLFTSGTSMPSAVARSIW